MDAAMRHASIRPAVPARIPSAQAPAAVVMVRPHHFTVNPQTAADNRFQVMEDGADFSRAAFDEITQAAERLRAEGVTVHLFEDEGRGTPDSVFPNNWFSTHAGGRVAIYPMKAENRRAERRGDVIDLLKRRYRVQEVIDYSGLEMDGLFLEGTGAMVLDHLDRVAYAARSERTDPIALERFCTHFGFEPMVFPARDASGADVYHTNVLMCVATRFVLIGLDLITDALRREEIVRRFEQGGRQVIALDEGQIRAFAGNAIELQGAAGRLLVLSATAHAALRPAQRAAIEATARLLPLAIPTIERAGGSVRCTIAGVHLAPRG